MRTFGVLVLGSFLLLVTDASAGLAEKIVINGKVSDQFDQSVVTIETRTGKVKVPRASLGAAAKDLAPGQSVSAELGFSEMLKLNSIPHEVIKKAREPASTCGGSGC